MAFNKSFKTLEQSHYDLTKVPSLEPNRLVGFINHFTTVISDSLRALEQASDHKFMELDKRIKICQKSLQILESRIDTIPFLKTRTDIVNPTAAAASNFNPCEDVSTDSNVPVVHEYEKDESNQASDEKEQDPRLVKFYKMLKVGVPLEAVKIKMVSEDIDQNLLVL